MFIIRSELGTGKVLRKRLYQVKANPMKWEAELPVLRCLSSSLSIIGDSNNQKSACVGSHGALA